MVDKSSTIFHNEMNKKTIKSANKSKKKYIKKYGDDTNANYTFALNDIEALDFLGAKNLVISDKNEKIPENAVIVGNIRMGYGHYRISIAMASCAKALGYEPIWLDLASFNETTGSKMIQEQNQMYSLASRISQKSKLFNKFVWDPLNCEGFKKISYNAKDQKNSELLVPIFRNIPKDIPYVATHVWPSQAAIHAGMTHVVNAIPDNWPMALHLSEGAIHTVQTEYAYLGYKTFNGFDKKPLNGMLDEDLKNVGCYVDHELLVNLEEDNLRRINRIKNNKPIRFLFTVGGAGAGYKQFLEAVKHLLPYVKENKATLFINFGDHLDSLEKMQKYLGSAGFFVFKDEFSKVKKFAEDAYNKDINGVYLIYNSNIFEAVYSTNLLMPCSDVLVTKPSELVYYPIPKIFMKHIGGHEVYGAIHGREYGDASWECDTKEKMNFMIDKMINDKEIIPHMCEVINKLKKEEYYDGAYKCIKLAVEGRKLNK